MSQHFKGKPRFIWEQVKQCSCRGQLLVFSKGQLKNSISRYILVLQRLWCQRHQWDGFYDSQGIHLPLVTSTKLPLHIPCLQNNYIENIRNCFYPCESVLNVSCPFLNYVVHGLQPSLFLKHILMVVITVVCVCVLTQDRCKFINQVVTFSHLKCHTGFTVGRDPPHLKFTGSLMKFPHSKEQPLCCSEGLKFCLFKF